MVRDPVCGMDIEEKDAAATSEHDGKTYYFCAQSCKKTFDKDPARFIKNGSGKERLLPPVLPGYKMHF
jgi:YHS domain-containing protein